MTGGRSAGGEFHVGHTEIMNRLFITDPFMVWTAGHLRQPTALQSPTVERLPSLSDTLELVRDPGGIAQPLVCGRASLGIPDLVYPLS